jgi:protein phosphatase
MAPETLKALLAGVQADLVLVGHTHWPLDVTVDGVRLVNPGTVSNPFPPDLRATYVVLEAGEFGYSVRHRQVDYDREAVVQEVRRANHPAAGFIIRCLRGQIDPPWA